MKITNKRAKLLNDLIEDDWNTIVECGDTDYLQCILEQVYEKVPTKDLKQLWAERFDK